MKQPYLVIGVIVLALILAACGTQASPQDEADQTVSNAQLTATAIVQRALDQSADTEDADDTADTADDAAEGDAVAVQPTTSAPEDAADDDAATTSDSAPADDLEAAVASADAAHGEELFMTFQADAGFACSTCHRPDSEERLIGPGLLNIGARAANRVEGQTVYEYIFTSIVNPDEYLVEGYQSDLMPENWEEIYSTEEIYDIMAYLLTLGDGGSAAAADSDDAGDAAVAADSAAPVAGLPADADPANGEALFTTFQETTGFACSTCHRPDSEERLIGPGLLNIGARATNRVEGQTAYEYVFTSIVNPDAHVVEGFQSDLMPENWEDVYNESELNDIIAYLFTLGEGGSTAAADTGDTAVTGSAAPVDGLPVSADASVGEELFTTFQADAGFACSTCHRPDSEERLIGPGLLNIGARAETRVDGQTAYEYVFTSIVNPDDYLVEGFQSDLMPENWEEIYSEEEINHIIAYLFTLGEGSAAAATGDTGDSAAAAESAAPASALPADADPAHGEELFTTFQEATGFACSTCHRPDSEERLIGPGLLNIGSRAETRIDGQTAYEYVFTSIVNPDDYLVEGFQSDLMPENWEEIYSESDINDIIAYLFTLGDGGAAAVAAPTSGTGTDSTEDAAASTTEDTDTDSTEDAAASTTEDTDTDSTEDAAASTTEDTDTDSTEDAAASTTEDTGTDSTEDAAAAPASGLPLEPPVSELPSDADPVRGEILFGTFQPVANFACSTCHRARSDSRLVGPGLLNIAEHAATRVEGQTAFEYIYTSIVNPDVFIVEGFPDNLMPENWAEVWNQDDVFDIIAFLMAEKESN